jgi:hypothetical protein
MRFFNWLYIAVAVFIGIMTLTSGFIGPSIVAFLAIVLALPPVWDRLKHSFEDTWPKTRGIVSIVLSLTALAMGGYEHGKTPAGKAALVEREKRELVDKQKVEAEEAEKLAVVEKTSRKGFNCLSGWDGSHRALVNTVEQQLRNPSSFEHIETSITPVDEKGQHRVMMKYRAENGFGGMNVEAVSAVIDHDSCDLLQVGM